MNPSFSQVDTKLLLFWRRLNSTSLLVPCWSAVWGPGCCVSGLWLNEIVPKDRYTQKTQKHGTGKIDQQGKMWERSKRKQWKTGVKLP